jgi:ribosomal protein S18 acetylase RimI-like enzyme
MVDLFVTYLEMTVPPSAPALAAPLAGAEIRQETLDPDRFLALYRAVGGPLRWDQRLLMPDAALRDFLGSPTTLLHILRLDGIAVGLCEFEGAGTREIELTHFGLVPEAQGRRLGPYLLDQALRAAWSRAPQRIWLHTDTWDHPKAIATYQRAGFEIYAQGFEVFPD